MQITLSSATSKPQKTNLQELFDGLWLDVKNKQQANARLRQELSEFHKIYHEKILPIEQLSVGAYSQLAQRLIEFFRKKSLDQWQRHELSQWIMECINTIGALHPEKTCELTASYQQALATYLQVDIEAIEEQMSQGARSLDEVFAGVGNPDTPPPYFSAGFADKLAQPFTGDVSEHAANNTDSNVNGQNLPGNQWLRAIFRRTAKALHPDKERNEALMSEKQELMAQLLAAREAEDVFSLLNLYMQYVDGDDLPIADETMGEICTRLNEQKNQLAGEKQDILSENPTLAELYKKLYSRNVKKRYKNIERHIQSVREATQHMQEFVVSLQNLEILKIHLEDRYEVQATNGQRAMGIADDPVEFYDA